MTLKKTVRYTLTSLVFTFLCLFAKTDTLDYWHVYLNYAKLKEFNISTHGKQEIVLNRKLIKSSDLLTVQYYNDTPCSKCTITLSFENERHAVIDQTSGRGTFSPLTVSLEKILLSKINYFEVYYYDENIKSRADKKLLFRIKIE